MSELKTDINPDIHPAHIFQPKKLDSLRNSVRMMFKKNNSSSDLPEKKEIKEVEGIKLDFIIENEYLITHTLASMTGGRISSSENQTDIVDFQNTAWETDKDVYDFLAGRYPAELIASQPGGLSNFLKKVPEFISKIETTPQFKKIRQQTEEYAKKCQESWEENYETSKQTLEDLSGLKLNKELEILVTHPNLKNGGYMGNNRIAWGHNEDFPNYSTVYLWHEVLHSYFDASDVSHSVIQYLTDNELRVKLNPEDKYPPFVGHQELVPLMEKMSSDWTNYKNGDNRNINNFVEQMKTKFPEKQAS